MSAYTLAVFSKDDPMHVIDQWECHSDLSAQKVLTLRLQGYRVAYWNGTSKLNSKKHEMIYSFGFPLDMSKLTDDTWDILCHFIHRFTEFGELSMDFICQEWTLYTVLPIPQERIKYLEEFLGIDIEVDKVNNVKPGWVVFEWKQSVDGYWSK